MKEVLLTTLRDRSTPIENFRQASNQLADLLAAETSQFIPKVKRSVETPLCATEGFKLSHKPVLAPILRSGLIFLPAFLKLYPEALVGIIGIRRDEVTAKPHLYYTNLPPLHANDPVFLLDPMLATGQTATLAVQVLKEKGIEESKIILVSIIAASEGLAHFKKHCPKVRTNIVQVDEKLTSKKMIEPGLGDFGDRYFGTIL